MAIKIRSTYKGVKALYSKEAVHARRVAGGIKAAQTRNIKKTIKAIVRQLGQKYNLNVYESKEIIALSLHHKTRRNSWAINKNNEFLPNKTLDISKENLATDLNARELLLKRASAKKPKNADFYIRKAMEDFKRNTNEINKQLIDNLPKGKAGLIEFTDLFRSGRFEENDELYDRLKKASKARSRLDEEERKRTDWNKVYEKANKTNKDVVVDWENYFAQELVESGA